MSSGDDSADPSGGRANAYLLESDDWDNIKALPLLDLSKQTDPEYSNTDVSSLASTRITLTVTLDQILFHFQNIEIAEQLSRIQPIQIRSGFYGLMSRLFCLNPQRLDSSLCDERNRVFAVALHPFSNHDAIQTKFLITIYQKLTGNALMDRRFGNHWEDIGFQGTDPATDLRGVGLLGLYQLLYFILSPETSHLCKEIYKLSLDKRQHFPFAVMSLQITGISLQVLREGLLNKEFNQSKCVIKVFNWFYSAVFLQLFNTWKENNKTIIDSGYVLKDIRKLVRKDVKRVILEMLNYKNNFQTNSNCNDKNTQQDITFTNLGDIFENIDIIDENTS
ncbi:ELMO domain-containing protein 3-like [Oppia nitens]|uniref:ELMO domain-containing protein 3-like n=1 Tax=Oppia nitens TaxID=1686743 RepID=UPI0023DC68DF|nr:ELMO domain-containing protein 3-like [Oppia nitens]